MSNQRYMGDDAKRRFFLKYKRLSNTNGFSSRLGDSEEYPSDGEDGDLFKRPASFPMNQETSTQFGDLSPRYILNF
jgi:hypothetical protein